MRSMRDIFRSYGILDAQGRHVNGTDKETNHRYGDAYDQILSVNYSLNTYHEPDDKCQHRTSIKLMMEVGVADGSSLLAWRDIFPNALCVGLDIHRAERLMIDRGCPDRIEFYLGSQTSLADCRRAAAGRMFDFIVEDATHQLDATLVTLLFLWPSVRPGGLYVIEEFANIGELAANVKELLPCAEIVPTTGPFGGCEPLVVLRKPL